MFGNKNKVKLLGKTIDNESIFDSHILNIRSKANKKLSVLCKFKKYFSSQGYPLSRFLRHSLSIAFLCRYSIVDPPITESTSYTKEP